MPRKDSILNAMQSVMGRLPEFESLNVPEMELLEEIDCGDYVRRKFFIGRKRVTERLHSCVFPKPHSKRTPSRCQRSSAYIRLTM